MASDIKNTGNDITGVQVIGNVVVNTGGRGAQLKQTQEDSPGRKEIPLADIHDKYDDRLDDPTYYG